MPWKLSDEGQVKRKFVAAMLGRRASVAGVCRQFGISRECGHKWWRRFRTGGYPALRGRARLPHAARRLQQRWRPRLFAGRRAHPTWGPQKLRWWLRRRYPRARLPSARTLGRWLTAAGLTRRRVRRARRGPQVPAPPRRRAHQPNDVWTIDFKGSFRTADGTRIYALTVRDLATRYVLVVRHVRAQSEAAVRAVLTDLFRRYGLPRALRADNGSPFARPGPLGLSQLSVWWLRLGLRVEFTRPACPQDNGAHEQMHRVLKRETAQPPAATARAQQQRFARWRRHYNQQRPHAALGQRVPARGFRRSARRWPAHLPEWSYPKNWARLCPGTNGRCTWQGRQRMIGRAFAGEQLGLKPRGPHWAEVYLGAHVIGTLHRADLAGLRPARWVRARDWSLT